MRRHKQFAFYILASRKRGTLYIGVTSDLADRIAQHRAHALPGFTATYHVTRLVHYEWLDSAESAIKREKQLKHWLRSWKIDLVEQANPAWRDLWPALIGEREIA
ncbi:MAG: GIY-YIG nuclease family protein [Micropepsaceae bacterium]